MISQAEDFIERVCISTNSVCNLTCKYCYFFQHPSKDLENCDKLSTDEIYYILAEINNYWITSRAPKKVKVNFVGSGEPLISWKEIYMAITKFQSDYPNHGLRFYTVTNGTLITEKILNQMKEINLNPSVSVDGSKLIHDKNRIYLNGKGSFDIVIEKLNLLKKHNFTVAINTTITNTLIQNIDDYMEFLRNSNIDKVIFDRLVDTPIKIPDVTYDEFYSTLLKLQNKITKDPKLKNLEIGNIEAFRRSFEGNPDKVCTMFGSSCGAGVTNIIYMQREVYPCGRMFGEKKWVLGDSNNSIKEFQDKMKIIMPKEPHYCESCEVRNDCIKDCILEQQINHYSCDSRKSFIKDLKVILS